MHTHKHATLKPLPATAGGLGSIPGSGRSPEGGYSNPLQYSCLENPHGQRSLAGYRPRVTKSRIRLSMGHTHARVHTLTHVNTHTQEHQAQHPCSWTHAREEGGWCLQQPSPPRQGGVRGSAGPDPPGGSPGPTPVQGRLSGGLSPEAWRTSTTSLTLLVPRARPGSCAWKLVFTSSPGACAQGTVPSAPLAIRPWPICHERKPRHRDVRP